MCVSVFDIPISDWPNFVYREFEYRLVKIPFQGVDVNDAGHGVACIGNYKNDAECEIVTYSDPIRASRWNEFREKYKEPMWREDLEPCPEYLQRCLEITKNLGSEFFDNFIDTTFLGDGRTVRDYIKV